MPDPKKTKAKPRKPAAAHAAPTTAAARRGASRKAAAPAKPAAKPAARPAKKASTKPVAKAAAKSAAKPATKPATKPAAKRAARPAAKPAATAAAKSAAKSATKPAAKPAARAAKPSPKAALKAARGARRPTGRAAEAARPPGTDPDGFFVARVRGEDAVRDAPHPMLEAGGFDEDGTLVLPVYDEGLGELPWSYGDDVLLALPRDPRTLFLYWDHAPGTLAAAFEGLDHPRAQLWLFVKGAGWERIRVVDFALESRCWYLHDLEPGRVYRTEIHLLDRQGRDRLLPHASNPMTLPPLGPSPVVDDRFVRIPWDLPLPRLLGAGVAGGPFSEELRALLARLSDWARFREGAAGAPGAGPDARTSSRGGPWPAGGPSSPSSPFGPFGGEGR